MKVTRSRQEVKELVGRALEDKNLAAAVVVSVESKVVAAAHEEISDI